MVDSVWPSRQPMRCSGWNSKACFVSEISFVHSHDKLHRQTHLRKITHSRRGQLARAENSSRAAPADLKSSDALWDHDWSGRADATRTFDRWQFLAKFWSACGAADLTGSMLSRLRLHLRGWAGISVSAPSQSASEFLLKELELEFRAGLLSLLLQMNLFCN